MKVPKYRVELTRAGESSAVNVTDVQKIRVNYGIDAIKDTFTIELSDTTNKYNIDINDRIKIYLYYLGNSEVLVMDGLVTELKNKAEEGRNTLTVKGNNILEILLNHQVRANFSSSTASSIIQNLLQRASENQPSNRQISWNAGNDTTTKVVSYYSEYKPVFEHIEKLSSDEYTGDGQYIFYLDQSDNSLVWKRRPTTISGTISYATHTISISRVKNANEVVNFYLINCGKDLNGNSIHTYKVNTTSIGKLGYRTKYEVRQEYAQMIKLLNITTDNNKFRDLVKALARSNADRIMNKYSDGINTLSIAVEGSTSYTAGQLYEIVFPHAGWTANSKKQLRLMEFEHNFDKSGWITNLEFKEELD